MNEEFIDARIDLASESEITFKIGNGRIFLIFQCAFNLSA